MKKKEEKNKEREGERKKPLKEPSPKEKVSKKEEPKPESKLEEEIEETSEDLVEFEESPIIVRNSNTTLQQSESSQSVPLEKQAREFILPQNEKDQRGLYNEKQTTSYSTGSSDESQMYSVSTSSGEMLSPSRVDELSLGRNQNEFHNRNVNFGNSGNRNDSNNRESDYFSAERVDELEMGRDLNKVRAYKIK